MRTLTALALLLITSSPAWSQADGWVEDSTPKIADWRRQMGGAAYRRALASTGMRGGTQKAGAGSAVWVQSGPHGGFGGNGDSGRVASLQLIDIGGVVWVYIGASGGGLYRCEYSSIGVWENLGATLPCPAVRAFSVSAGDPDQIVVGTGDWMRYRGAGFYRTTDGGVSWDPVTGADTVEHVFRILRSPSNDPVLVAATDKGILRSTDGGQSWDEATLGGADITGRTGDVRYRPDDPEQMLAVVEGTGLLQSDDGGATWTALGDPVFPAASQWGRGVIAFCADSPDTIAVAHERNKVLRLYRTTNGGTSWADATPTLPADYNDQLFHALALAIRPNDPNEILLGTVGIARSYWDGSKLAWQIGPQATGITEGHSDYVQLHFDPLTGDDILWQASDGGLYMYWLPGSVLLSYQGGGSTGLAISQIAQLDADRSMMAIGLQDNGVLSSVDAGQSWLREQIGDGGDNRIVNPEGFDYWFSKNSGGGWQVYRSEYGQSLVEIPRPPNLITRLSYVPKTQRVWGSDFTSVYSAPAYGNTQVPWNSYWSTEIAGGIHPGSYVIAGITASPVENGTVFVAYRDHRDLTVVQPNVSPPHLIPNIGQPVSGVPWPVQRITPSTQWGGECWVALNGPPGQPKIQHVVRYGANPATDVQDLTANLDSHENVWVVEPKPFDPMTLYAGTDFGVYRSTDGGASWQPFQDGLPICQVKDMVFVVDDAHTGNHVLHIATYGHGTWQRTIPAAPILYVDNATVTATHDGTFEHPYLTIDAAVNAAPVGAIVAIRSAVYAAPLIVDQDVHLVTWAGRSYVQ